MKYIRTKQDCIVDTTNMCPETLKWYQEVHLLKQANTIEELCDYFIYNEYEEDGNGKLIFRKVFHGHEKDQLKNIMLENGGNIKLGILTDKGLIYVAKINDMGELELL